MEGSRSSQSTCTALSKSFGIKNPLDLHSKVICPRTWTKVEARSSEFHPNYISSKEYYFSI
jgi:hypothetical protein